MLFKCVYASVIICLGLHRWDKQLHSQAGSWGFPARHGATPSLLDAEHWKILWTNPHFRKPPYNPKNRFQKTVDVIWAQLELHNWMPHGPLSFQRSTNARSQVWDVRWGWRITTVHKIMSAQGRSNGSLHIRDKTWKSPTEAVKRRNISQWRHCVCIIFVA